MSQRLPQMPSAELIAELEAILIELRRRLDDYLERGRTRPLADEDA